MIITNYELRIINYQLKKMTWIEVIRIAFEALLGGGLIKTLLSLKTLKKKEAAEVKKVQAESTNLGLDNADKAAHILMTRLVEPLEERISTFEEQVKQLNDEIGKLRKAIQRGYSCKYRRDCPIIHKLQEQDDCNGDKNRRSVRTSKGHGDSAEAR